MTILELEEDSNWKDLVERMNEMIRSVNRLNNTTITRNEFVASMDDHRHHVHSVLGVQTSEPLVEESK